MTEGYAIDMVRHLIGLACLLAGPILVGGLVVGLVMGVLQAATQVQESALTFLPKLLVAAAAVTWGGPWALGQLTAYAVQMFGELMHLGPQGRG